MAEHIEIPHFDWNEVGYKAFLAEEVNHTGHTLSTFSAHLKLESRKNELETRLVVFDERSKRIVDDVLPWSPQDVRTACNLPRNGSSNDPLFAQAMGAELGMPGKFARKGSRLTLYGRTQSGREIPIYLFLYSRMMAVLTRYMDYHFSR